MTFDSPSRAVLGDTKKTQDDAKPRSTGRSIALFLRDILFILLAAIVISFLIKTFLIRSFYIPSGSMEHTLEINDRIIVNELVPKVVPINRGDVVVFTDPGGWLTPTPQPVQTDTEKFFDNVLSVVGLTAPDSNDHLIKRVIGLPGDTVSCCTDFGLLTVNGVPIEEPYITLPDPSDDAATLDFTVTVPDGYIWVMGDNRYNSRDSSLHMDEPSKGFIAIDSVVGRAMLISWPSARWTWLDNYPATFQGVDKKPSKQ
jgi:signal peptidase I